jgi:hypothetical protein
MSVSTLTGLTGATPHSSPLLTSFGGPTTPQLLLETQQVPLLTQYFLPAHGMDDGSGMAELGIPSLATITKNLAQRHVQELKETADSALPRLNIVQQLRKSFREFYSKEQQHVFSFLDSDVASSETLSSCVQVLKRFGRADYTANRCKVRDLPLDFSFQSAVSTIQESLNLGSLEKWVEQTKQLLEIWRQTTQLLFSVEKRMEAQLKVFQDLHARMKTTYQLPPNEVYDTLIFATEAYMKRAFDDSKLEELYTEYISCIKRLIVLTDAMNLVRLFVNASTEPVCSVCMTEPVGLAAVPCGHTFCHQCGMKQMLTCYICRTPVKERQKLFFS